MKRGDVVVLDWPFSDLSGAKQRPALVVQANFLNGLIDDTVFVKITGRHYGIPGTEVKLDPSIETDSGLSKLCYASCKDLLTRDRFLAGPVIGFVSDAAMREVEGCLRTVLQIP